MGKKTKCGSYCEVNDRCQSCHCVDVDLVQAIQGMIDYDDSRIAAGQYLFGRNISLENDHIKRIHKSTAREIEMIKAGIPFCDQFGYREGRFRNQPLMPIPEWKA